MRFKFLLASVSVLFAAFLAEAGGLQRIGHTTLTPRHSNPDDKGMYAALIDPVNGYAYFVGTYLFKLDLSGPLPVPVGPALNTGQFASGAIVALGSAKRLYIFQHATSEASSGYTVALDLVMLSEWLKSESSAGKQSFLYRGYLRGSLLLTPERQAV
jgi:hypothetical protein